MGCYEQLKARLSTLEPTEYAQAFGYTNPGKFAKAIKQLQQHTDLTSWLQSGFYDLRHTAESFLLTGAEILNFPIAQCRSELEVAQQRLHQLAQAEQPTLTVELSEVGKQHLSKLGFMGRMGISSWMTHTLDKQAVIDLDQAALRKYIVEHIKAHQQLPAPNLLKGEVIGYRYRHTDGTIIHFGKEGNPND